MLPLYRHTYMLPLYMPPSSPQYYVESRSLFLSLFRHLIGISTCSLLRGKVPALVRELIKDTRRMMSPYTALKLKERKSNSLKDYLALSGTLGVSHLLCFSTTETGTYLRYL
jgi:hypothetical protein